MCLRTPGSKDCMYMNDDFRGLICPRCGQPGVCFHDGDVGGGEDYVDQYHF